MRDTLHSTGTRPHAAKARCSPRLIQQPKSPHNIEEEKVSKYQQRAPKKERGKERRETTLECSVKTRQKSRKLPNCQGGRGEISRHAIQGCPVELAASRHSPKIFIPSRSPFPAWPSRLTAAVEETSRLARDSSHDGSARGYVVHLTRSPCESCGPELVISKRCVAPGRCVHLRHYLYKQVHIRSAEYSAVFCSCARKCSYIFWQLLVKLHTFYIVYRVSTEDDWHLENCFPHTLYFFMPTHLALRRIPYHKRRRKTRASHES